MNMNIKNKYFKYKQKYLELKKMFGGVGDKEIVNQILQLTNNKKILIIDDYKNIF